MAMHVTLVGKSGRGCCGGDRLAGLQQAASGTDALGHLKRVRRQTRALAEEAHEPELADAGGRGELV